MFTPATDGFSVRGSAVRYTEQPSTDDLSEVVHCFWELRTQSRLSEDFQYLALPDACVNLLLNLSDVSVAGITALHTEATTLNLGRTFHYVGVQLYPGVWRGNRSEVLGGYVGEPYRGRLPLVETSRRLVGLELADMVPILADLVRWCLARGYAELNATTACLLCNLDDIRSVADMAATLGLSTRQLQRTIPRLTGFAPHNLLKVLRLQQSFRRHYLDLYADQAHFTHCFKRATGYTPGQYRQRFGV
jgi:AraC-like DNA-binding protein